MKYNGKLFYVFPTATKDKIYVGKQAQFNRYKKAIAAHKASQPTSNFQYTQEKTNPPTKTYEKTNNINRYRQYRCGPGINIRLPDYRHRRGVASQQGQTGGQPGQQLIQGQSLYPTLETAGPNNIEVQQFGGFGPMGTAALGDW